MNRRLMTLGTFAGGIAAAAFVGMSAAHADVYEYTLDDSDFYQQLSTTPFHNELLGTTYLDIKDVTTGVTTTYGEYGYGNEVLNPLTGAVQSFDITTYNESDNAFGIPDGSQIDVTEFGSGFANELVNMPAATAGAMDTITDTLITPFGDFTLFTF